MTQDTLVVGAPGANGVEVLEFVHGIGFEFRQLLTPASATATTRFGASVALDGASLAVGAPGAEAVFVYTRQGDGSMGGAVRVAPAFPLFGAMFGSAVAMRGDRLVIGAPMQDSRAGAAYVYDRQASGGFLLVATLRPAELAADDELGTAVALSDDGLTVFVSAVRDDDGGTDAGAVYVFEDQGGAFVRTDKLVPPDAAAFDVGGRALAVAGDVLAVGVRNDDDGGRESGSVVLWSRAGGAFAHAGKLLAPDRMTGDLFGHSVALHGDRALVGALARDRDGFMLDVGRAYLFERDTAGVLTFVQQFDSPVQQLSGHFGSAVALSVRGLAIGGAGANSGAGEVLAVTDQATVDPLLSTVEVDRNPIETGEVAVVTVTPRDATGALLGAGRVVDVATTLGQLQGTVLDLGDGSYTQRVLGDLAGTAEISVTVDSVALSATVALQVRDPAPLSLVVGQRADGSMVPFDSIQQAIEAVDALELVRVGIAPGQYDEVVRLRGLRDLELIGAASHGLVTVRGLRISYCRDVIVEGLHVRRGERGLGGVRIDRENHRVMLHNMLVESTRWGRAGITISHGNRDIRLISCHVQQAAGDGIRAWGSVRGLEIHHCTVIESRRNGISIGAWARDVLLTDNTVLDNGGDGGRRCGGYGIVRKGWGCRRVAPTDVTLRGNDVRGNNGRVRRGRSTADFGRYDLMLDETDDQPIF